MTEPIIAKITDPEAGMVEMLQEAQLLINQRDAYRRALELACCKIYALGVVSYADPDGWHQTAIRQLESEKINSGKVT